MNLSHKLSSVKRKRNHRPSTIRPTAVSNLEAAQDSFTPDPSGSRSLTPPTPDPSKMVVPVHNALWGIVYDVNGERIGAGVMRGDQSVVVQPAVEPDAPPVPDIALHRKHTYIGLPRTTWRAARNPKKLPLLNLQRGQRAYVGNRSMLTKKRGRPAQKSRKPALHPRPHSVSPIWVQGGEVTRDSSASGESSPLTPLSDSDEEQVDLVARGFAIASALNAVKG